MVTTDTGYKKVDKKGDLHDRVILHGMISLD
jgi:hypothetical protein